MTKDNMKRKIFYLFNLTIGFYLMFKVSFSQLTGVDNIIMILFIAESMIKEISRK